MTKGQSSWYCADFKIEVIQKYLSENSKIDPFCK